MLIILEGLDGAGKTTIASILKDRLAESGAHVSVTHFPTAHLSIPDDGERGPNTQMRDLNGFYPLEKVMAYLIDMYKMTPLLCSKLIQKEVVIIDRFYYSTMVYQLPFFKREEERAAIYSIINAIHSDLMHVASKGFWSFFLEVPVPVVINRVKARGMLSSYEDIPENEWYTRAILYHKYMADENIILCGERTPKEIAEDILTVIFNKSSSIDYSTAFDSGNTTQDILQ